MNGPSHIECQVLKNVVTLASKTEISGISLNIKIAIWIRRMLEALGNPQSIVLMNTDNSTAEAFSNLNLKEKRSKV